MVSGQADLCDCHVDTREARKVKEQGGTIHCLGGYLFARITQRIASPPAIAHPLERWPTGFRASSRRGLRLAFAYLMVQWFSGPADPSGRRGPAQEQLEHSWTTQFLWPLFSRKSGSHVDANGSSFRLHRFSPQLIRHPRLASQPHQLRDPHRCIIRSRRRPNHRTS